jgi:hypothetical protein
MPFIVFTPIPAIPTPSGNFGAISGGGVQTELDYTNTLGALGVQLQQIQYYLSGGPGGIASNELGSLTNILMKSSASLAGIEAALQALVIGDIEDTGASLSGANSIQQSLSTVAGLLTTMIAMQQMQMAATMQHQEFVEQTTNTARQEDNKPAITPKSEDYIKKIQTASTGVANIATISAASGAATALAGDALTAGATYAKNLILSTDLGAAMLVKAKEIKTYVASVGDKAAQTAKSTVSKTTAEIEQQKRTAKSTP